MDQLDHRVFNVAVRRRPLTGTENDSTPIARGTLGSSGGLALDSEVPASLKIILEEWTPLDPEVPIEWPWLLTKDDGEYRYDCAISPQRN